jgi:hypothetical protein
MMKMESGLNQRRGKLMTKKYLTVVFEYEEGANLPLNLTAAFSGHSREYEDCVITAVSMEDEISRVEELEELYTLLDNMPITLDELLGAHY